MTKRLIILGAVLLPLLAVAQMAVGGWDLYSSFSGLTDIVETPDKVYYLSGGEDNSNLFSYDKKSDESYAYTSGNKLNDTGVKFITYNKAKDYLVVVYASSNIDVIKGDGSIVNLGDIKDATLSLRKDVTSVSFDNEKDNMYVCTNFGLVRYNDKRFEVVETGMYDTQIDMAGVVGDYLLIRNNNTLKFINRESSITRLANFRNLSMTNVIDLRAMDGDRAMVLRGSSAAGSNWTLYIADFDFEAGRATLEQVKDVISFTKFHEGKNHYSLSNSKSVMTVNPKTAEVRWWNMQSGTNNGNRGVIWDISDKMWVGSNTSGLSAYKLGQSNGTVTYTKVYDNICPSELTLNRIRQICAGPDGRIYFGDYAPSAVSPGNGTSNSSVVNVLGEDGHFTDVTNTDLSSNKLGFNARTFQTIMTPDPTDPDVYWTAVGMWSAEYVLKTKADGTPLYALTAQNRPAELIADINDKDKRAWYPEQVFFDNQNNLWVIAGYSENKLPLMRLPAAKAKLNNIETSDWEVIQGYTGAQFTMDTYVTVCKKSNAFIITDTSYNGHLVTYNTRGTNSLADDVIIEHVYNGALIDQDGKSFTPTSMYRSVEDHNGRVWIGTSSGVIEISDPEAFSTTHDSRVTRLKVPRNDGTNFADYLLDAISVLDIAVDDQNRKWCATLGSGVYLVSADGREILEHYTMDNSTLPSNDVYAVLCDPNSSNVYFGTISGLVVYNSTTSPAADNYDNVYAYPNPVRPEYTGWITVSGLMDGSLVKIADASGNVFYSGRSEGGMIVWDGCNNDGQRVKTGVYYVFASQNENGSSGAVTKILVVN